MVPWSRRANAPTPRTRPSTAHTPTSRTITPAAASVADSLYDPPDRNSMIGVDLRRKWRIAVDFGTTYSAVAALALRPNEEIGGSPEKFAERVIAIDSYAHDPRQHSDSSAKEVPTELLYYDPSERYPAARRKSPPPKKQKINFSRWRPINDDTSSSESDDEVEADPDAFEHSLGTSGSADLPWGFTVSSILGTPIEHVPRSELYRRRVRRMKLLLDSSEDTQDARNEIYASMPLLRNSRATPRGWTITKPEDSIVHFLTQLFRHAKSELEQKHGYSTQCETEFVLCVPPLWDFNACQKMNEFMAEALRCSGMQVDAADTVKSLLIVSEPIAASTWVLTTWPDAYKVVKTDVSFLMLDAGGGTSDLAGYTIRKSHGFVSTQRDEAFSTGAMCGGAFLNQDFKKFLQDKLRNEAYLKDGSGSIDHILESKDVMLYFERNVKRRMDFSQPIMASFQIHGLRPDPDENFLQGHLRVTGPELKKICKPWFHRMEKLIEKYLRDMNNKAAEKSIRIYVPFVLIIGGFGQCMELKKYLEKKLKKHGIEIIIPTAKHGPSQAVAAGAILCALRTSDRVRQISRVSYGLSSREVWDDKEIGHQEAIERVKRDLDDVDCLEDVLTWFLRKGDVIPDADTPPIRKSMIHLIDVREADTADRWISRHAVYVSETCTKDHYDMVHPENHDPETGPKYKKIGQIAVDLSFLRGDRRLQVRSNGGRRKKKKRPYLQVEFAILFQVVDRNLFWKAVWPNDSEDEVPGTHSWSNITAAFDFAKGDQRA